MSYEGDNAGSEAKKPEAEYFSKDFEWEELRSEVESNPSFRYHLLPFQPSESHPQSEADVQAWKRFHVRHSSGKFFKERRYLLKEFPELLTCPPNAKLLEAGCGNGSTALPILRANKDVIVYACDCSSETLERAEQIINAVTIAAFKHRFHTFCCDFSSNEFPNWLACNPCQDKFSKKQSNCLSDVKEDNGMLLTNSYLSDKHDCCVGGVDFLTLIFTLSAIPLERMPRSIKECFAVLKPGGRVLFRDYGLYDMTMLRFEQDKRVGFREYMRLDGTRSYFFCLDTVRDLFLGAGFIELELDYCCVCSVNRRKGKCMKRVWVHGKFQKPALTMFMIMKGKQMEEPSEEKYVQKKTLALMPSWYQTSSAVIASQSSSQTSQNSLSTQTTIQNFSVPIALKLEDENYIPTMEATS